MSHRPAMLPQFVNTRFENISISEHYYHTYLLIDNDQDHIWRELQLKIYTIYTRCLSVLDRESISGLDEQLCHICVISSVSMYVCLKKSNETTLC